MNNEQFTLINKALSDPNRLQIIQMITQEERCACKLLAFFDITQPTLSHHMRILSDCDLVHIRKDGKWSHYSMNLKTLSDYSDFVNQIYQSSLAAVSDGVSTKSECCEPDKTEQEKRKCSF